MEIGVSLISLEARRLCLANLDILTRVLLPLDRRAPNTPNRRLPRPPKWTPQVLPTGNYVNIDALFGQGIAEYAGLVIAS